MLPILLGQIHISPASRFVTCTTSAAPSQPFARATMTVMTVSDRTRDSRQNTPVVSDYPSTQSTFSGAAAGITRSFTSFSQGPGRAPIPASTQASISAALARTGPCPAARLDSGWSPCTCSRYESRKSAETSRTGLLRRIEVDKVPRRELLQSRIECVAEAVAEEIEAEHGDEDGQAGKEREPRIGLDEGDVGLQIPAPARCRRLCA